MTIVDNNCGESDKSMHRPFEKRWDISLDYDTVYERFITRIQNGLHYHFEFLMSDQHSEDDNGSILVAVANTLGRKYVAYWGFDRYIDDADKYSLLRALEGLYVSLPDELIDVLDPMITNAINMSEIDLGIQWENGMFLKTGAKLLDEELINVSLTWLSDDKYKNIY